MKVLEALNILLSMNRKENCINNRTHTNEIKLIEMKNVLFPKTKFKDACSGRILSSENQNEMKKYYYINVVKCTKKRLGNIHLT